MQNQEENMQPPFQKGSKETEGSGSHGENQKWNTDELSNEASQKDADEIQRQTLRGDESEGNPDNRDYAGSADSKDTPQGREEAKNDVAGKSNINC